MTSMRSRSGRGDGVQRVGRGDEENLRQVERQVQVVVAEGDVLLRIQNLQKRGGGIPLEGGAQLVYLVDHVDRAFRLDDLETLNDLARHGPDIRPPVALDFRLVTHAADRKAEELPAEGTGD